MYRWNAGQMTRSGLLVRVGWWDVHDSCCKGQLWWNLGGAGAGTNVVFFSVSVFLWFGEIPWNCFPQWLPIYTPTSVWEGGLFLLSFLAETWTLDPLFCLALCHMCIGLELNYLVPQQCTHRGSSVLTSLFLTWLFGIWSHRTMCGWPPAFRATPSCASEVPFVCLGPCGCETVSHFCHFWFRGMILPLLCLLSLKLFVKVQQLLIFSLLLWGTWKMTSSFKFCWDFVLGSRSCSFMGAAFAVLKFWCIPAQKFFRAFHQYKWCSGSCFPSLYFS